MLVALNSVQGCASDVLKILAIEWDVPVHPLGLREITGIKPSQCFRFDCSATVPRQDDLDLPPDLAIEIDVTSRTHLDIYTTLGVKEVWRFRKTQLEINQLRNGVYVVTPESQFFPGIDLAAQISQFIQQARTESWNKAYKAFRDWAIANRPADF
jgi:hypothetical protein